MIHVAFLSWNRRQPLVTFDDQMLFRWQDIDISGLHRVIILRQPYLQLGYAVQPVHHVLGETIGNVLGNQYRTRERTG
ncbi:hypothetical protein D3C81_1730210 [compost metagenome]